MPVEYCRERGSDRTRVSADATRFQQIASNSLSNAIKFTEPGVRARVSVRRHERGGELEVADTGRGIDPGFLPHVFERFSQGDSSSRRRSGGLGLGLWLVQELVRAHGGSIEASSGGVGQGSTFRVRLPLAAD